MGLERFMQEKKLAIVTSKKYFGQSLNEGLGTCYSVELLNYVPHEMDSRGKLDVCIKEASPDTTIVLAGYDEGSVTDIIWRSIRSIDGALNPVLVLGYQSKKSFKEKYPEFRDGVERHHRYINFPCTFDEIRESVSKLHPLYDDIVRKNLYTAYAESDLRKRLPRLMHNLKGANVDIELALARNVAPLCERLGSETINKLMDDMVRDLLGGDLENVKTYREKILNHLKEKRNV